MTQVGHSLTGLTIGVIFLPPQVSTRWKISYFVCFIGLAAIPDLPFKHWGHARYDISHSLFVNGAVILLLFGLLTFLPKLRETLGNTRVMFGGACAWLSHLLLDTFYNHGHGLAMFWPFSEARLALPIPWFSVLPSSPPPFTLQHLQIYGIEGLAYGPIFGVVLGLRILLSYRHSHDIPDSNPAH